MVHRFKKIAPLLLITILAVGGVEAFYALLFSRLLVIPKPATLEEKASGAAAPSTRSPNTPADPQVILKRNLFGPPPKKEKPAVAEQSATDQPLATTLDLSLIGTIAGPTNSRRAIILDKKKKLQDIYYQGDMVQNALIKDIQRGKIILSVNGKDEILIPEPPKTKAGAPVSPEHSASMPPDMPPEEPTPEAPPETVVEPPPEAQPPAVIEPEPIVNQPDQSAPGADNEPLLPNRHEQNMNPQPRQHTKQGAP